MDIIKKELKHKLLIFNYIIISNVIFGVGCFACINGSVKHVQDFEINYLWYMWST